MLDIILFLLFGSYFAYLAAEALSAARYRCIIPHVIYINGTRGKTSVTRLIDAGLRQGGWRTYAKTTGTLPMVIDTVGREKLIHRRGRANIKEQLRIVRAAAQENAQILIIECMAIDPQLQYISQHRMVKADIGVITNVRPDHLDVMGHTLDEIGQSLCNTIPKGGICFTADEKFFPAFSARCKNVGTEPRLILPDGTEPEIDFAENIALAIAVCRQLGVESQTALEGMRHYCRDPYALSFYRLRSGAVFIGGLSINDPVSIQIVYNQFVERMNFGQRRLILLITNRSDRGYRTLQHQELAVVLKPAAIWIMGGSSCAMARAFFKKMPDCPVTILKNAVEVPLRTLDSNDMIFAVGNIGEGGKAIMERIEKEGVPYV
ncbi:poly-gamma-glutamate synthase PgsB [Lutispora saccharofermentans]|uniref:Poly-gamma-glutamate synthase PgsB n=1 Tax=Lutispora saccharofermentans TaxID=3024236 RepID=A0ABT1NJB6_9FIRM|nr:poly-gamma-glutamate synthase PgsB [Lutispora saccharofermentans]MCQ1531368.1 poly-gamma-glutamate synthase PgsB [Lutispora saccharofermentans]